MNNLNIEPWKDQQLLNAEERIKELERENKELKTIVHNIKDRGYWESIRLEIRETFDKLPLRSMWGTDQSKFTTAVSSILRITFNLNQIYKLSHEQYEKSKEFTDKILEFLKNNYVENKEDK